MSIGKIVKVIGAVVDVEFEQGKATESLRRTENQRW